MSLCPDCKHDTSVCQCGVPRYVPSVQLTRLDEERAKLATENARLTTKLAKAERRERAFREALASIAEECETGEDAGDIIRAVLEMCIAIPAPGGGEEPK